MEVGLEVGGSVGSRYGSSVGKYVKGGYNVIIGSSVSWGIYRDVRVEFCIVVYVRLKITKVDSNLWVHF